MEENILVSNIIYISLIVLCLVLIIILFKQLRTTNKFLKTTQDKFHTKLSALENKYASTININTKPTITIQTTVEETPITRHEAFVNNIPLYAKKFFATTASIMFTAFILYSLYSSAAQFYKSYYKTLDIPYLEGLNRINLWSFYISHPQILIATFVSINILLIIYITAWVDAIKPQTSSIFRKILSSFCIAFVIGFSYFEFFRISSLWYYFFYICAFTTFLTYAQYSASKNNKPAKKQEDKIILYSVSYCVLVYSFSWYPIGTVSVNNYIASYYGQSAGKDVLIKILDDKYLKSRNHIILKATQENIYLLDCEGSECTGLRKINDDKVALAFFERKDFTFYSESKEKTD